MDDALRGSAAVAGIGYSRSPDAPTGFSRNSNEAVLTLVVRSVREACLDAGLQPHEIDGAITYQINDSALPHDVLCAIGAKEISYELNLGGGGNYSAQVILQAAMAVHYGLAKVCLVYRGLNGRSGVRMGQLSDNRTALGGGSRDSDCVGGPAQYAQPYGMAGAVAIYALQANRWMQRFGLGSEDLAALAVQSRRHAGLNPRALMRAPLTLADHQSSRLIVEPYHLFDCCLETDVACALIVTSAERARSLRQPPVGIMAGVTGPTQYADLADTGLKYTGDALLSRAGISRPDIDVCMFYDNFSDNPLRMIEDLKLCGPGESPSFVRDGHTTLDGDVAIQTSGGMMNEGYAHGLNNALELVQQLRGQAEDTCEGWSDGNHRYERDVCRQVRDARVGLHCGSTAKTAIILMRQ